MHLLILSILNNKVCKELFNDTLITKEGYSFGKVDETISIEKYYICYWKNISVRLIKDE